jgi:hypothetical protein
MYIYEHFVSNPRGLRRMCFGPPRSTTVVFRTPARNDGRVSDPRGQRHVTLYGFGYQISTTCVLYIVPTPANNISIINMDLTIYMRIVTLFKTYYCSRCHCSRLLGSTAQEKPLPECTMSLLHIGRSIIIVV